MAEISNEDPIAQYEFLIKSILDVARSLAVTSGQGSCAESQSRSSNLVRAGRSTRPVAPWWNDGCGEAIVGRKIP